MLGQSPGIKISISSKSGHSTFTLSTVDILTVSQTRYIAEPKKGPKSLISPLAEFLFSYRLLHNNPGAKWLPIFSCCFFSQPSQIHVMWGDSTKSSLSADSSSALQTDRRTDRRTDRQTDRRKCDLNSGASTTKRLIKTDECLLLLSSCIRSRSKRDTCRCGALWITPNAPTETSTNNINNNNNKFK